MYSILLSIILKVRSEKRRMSYFHILKYLEINKIVPDHFSILLSIILNYLKISLQQKS